VALVPDGRRVALERLDRRDLRRDRRIRMAADPVEIGAEAFRRALAQRPHLAQPGEGHDLRGPGEAGGEPLQSGDHSPHGGDELRQALVDRYRGGCVHAG
jgi:hypothetical protein